MRAAALLLLTVLPPGTTTLRAQDGSVVVYVVRHAERADDGAPGDMMLSDPPLSEEGLARARRLADLLRPAGITHVHSTDLLRTRSTARPLSEAEGLEVEIYEPESVSALASGLRATPGIHLVVGHSNTNPALVEALGGDPGEPIGPLEYDRIYVVHVLPDGSAGSAIFRYGLPRSATRRPAAGDVER